MSKDFSWLDEKDSVAATSQAAIAVYQNADGDVVIRQQASYGEDDHIIVVNQKNLPELIQALGVPLDGTA
jgi:hypothetical protein